MQTETLEIKAALQISKPVNKVFEAIVDPEKMTNYFISKGWANFLACLKAYLEYGINLRKGAFDFMSEKT